MNTDAQKLRILVTGGTGLLGSALLKELEERGHDVDALRADIRNAGALRDIAKEEKACDWIIHTAAMTDVSNCEEDRQLCYDTNVLGTKNIRDLASGVKARLIYISTASVFSWETGGYKELDLPYPKNYYDLSKLLGEQLVLEYRLGLILRINLIGIHPQGSRGQNFFEWLLDSVKANRDIHLFNDVIINPLSNITLAELIGRITEIKPTERILHLGSSNHVSKAAIGKLVIKHIKEYSGKADYVSIDSIPGGAPRPKQMWLNMDYAQHTLGFTMPSLESEVEKILNHYTN